MDRATRWLILLGVTFATAGLIAFLAPIMGPSATSASFIPAAVAGSLLGMRVGLGVGAASAVVTQVALVVIWARAPFGVDVFYSAIHLGMGAAFGWLHDLRERLRDGAAKDRLLFDQNPLPVMVIDRETQRFLDVNRAAVEHYGYDRDKWLSMRAFDIRPPEEIALYEHARNEVRDRPVRVETRHVKADGTLIDVVVTASQLQLDGRDVVYAMTEDVTERRHAEDSVRRTERLSALGTLVAGVAHEINNPLAYMQGNVELTQLVLAELKLEPGIPDRVRHEIEQALDGQAAVLRGIEQIARITKSLRQVARRSDGRPEEVDLDALVRETLQVARSRLSTSVDVQAELGSGQRVHVIPGELAQVLLNLLFNAADAVRNAKEPRIAVRTRTQGGEVVLEVQDNGEGISEAASAKLFVPFFTTKAEGTGLGLSISQRIVSDHGGTISVESRPGEGATFRVKLPVRA